jgi:hypothetical protein
MLPRGHRERFLDFGAPGSWDGYQARLGSIGYVDVVVRDGEWWIYREMTRRDGAHELRVARVPAPRPELQAA